LCCTNITVIQEVFYSVGYPFPKNNHVLFVAPGQALPSPIFRHPKCHLSHLPYSSTAVS
jgi:hypothetical protein